MISTDDISLPHLVNLIFARFHCCEVTISLSLPCFFGSESLSLVHSLNGEEVYVIVICISLMSFLVVICNLCFFFS